MNKFINSSNQKLKKRIFKLISKNKELKFIAGFSYFSSSKLNIMAHIENFYGGKYER